MKSTARTPAVLLISPGVLRASDLDFGLPHLVALGSYLRAHLSVRVEIVDLCYEGGDPQHLATVLTGLGPFEVVGVSCYSSFDYLRSLSVGRFVKRLFPDAVLVGGGYHVSALPEDLLFDGSPFDSVICGEAERPLVQLLETVIGGGRPERKYARDQPTNLDELPPYDWSLLSRYWPRAHELGRKLQIYLARGCPYRCTFCRERAKSGYSWRGFSSERAVDELVRLSRVTDLSRWVVNIADPLFGWPRAWRREVLEGIIKHGLAPRQFWTLTRADDLQDEDVSLLARARFSIGIGFESGSPEMLRLMQKGNTPEKYLAAISRLMDLGRKHGLSWAANIIVGHPGETPKSMVETYDFLKGLYARAGDSSGWLSVDPFRLYPGAFVHENRAHYETTYGTRFHHPEWWKSFYDGSFRAQHVEPSSSLSYEARVRFMYDRYGPLVADIAGRFRGQGRSVDRVFERSLAEQVDLLSPRQRDLHLEKAKRVVSSKGDAAAVEVSVPIGFSIRDPRIARREQAVRQQLARGALMSAPIVEALLTVDPGRYLDSDEVDAMFDHRPLPAEGEPRHLPFGLYVVALEALGLSTGDRFVDLAPRSGYLNAVVSALVGDVNGVTQFSGDPTRPGLPVGSFDGLFFDRALPRMPLSLRRILCPQGGRAVVFLGPRFRAQDLVCIGGGEVRDATNERRLAQARVPASVGAQGWIRAAPPTP